MTEILLKKALETIALSNSEGMVSDDLLIKASENYKIKSSEFLDDYDYNLRVAKSLHDHLNNVDPDEEVCKAIVPGQTKVVDGVMYIYVATPGAKTLYDWRVYKGNKKIGKQVSDSDINAKQKAVNDMFPSDLTNLRVVSKLGGSTGAQLVEDSAGNKYVMKRGKNTSNNHVRSEYITNQLYEILGQKVPDYELYDDNGEAVLLSKFIPMTRKPNTGDYDNMAKGFVSDALLANWDIYQNDNCLIDSAGRVIRVDNGGSLNYRAQGGTKQFGSSVISFDSMQKYNQSVVQNLSKEDLVKQIDEVLKKKDDVVNFLNVSGESNLANIFDGRFNDLVRIKNDLQNQINSSNRKVLPRKLKPASEMYRDFTEAEMVGFWNSVSGRYDSKINSKDKYGWELLANICKSRGFDARPRVVDEKEYWDLVSKNKYQMFRGIAPDATHKAQEFVDDFKYNDNCFFGGIGAHGEGIYAHINDGDNNKDNTQSTYKNSDAYSSAKSYANQYSSRGRGEILECILDPSAKIAYVDDLKKEILDMISLNKPAVDAKQKEIDALNAELKQMEDDLNNITDKTIKDVKNKMHWDEDTLVMHQIDIDSVDWGKLNADGEHDYPSFDDFVKKKMFDWVKKNGGKVDEKVKNSDVFVFSLPNSSNRFMLSRYQWENNAIKRKNAFAKPYNYPLKRFQEWMMKEHYELISEKVNKAVNELGSTITDMKKEIRETKDEINKKIDELNTLKKGKDPNGDIMSGIYEYVRTGGKEAIGIYAALKGYDAMIKPHGNGSPNSFAIILNRSKVIVKK